MRIDIVSYSGLGMARIMYVAKTIQSGKSYYVSRDGVHLRDRPHPGDLFETAEIARDFFVKLGNVVEIVPQQGAAIHPGLPG